MEGLIFIGILIAIAVFFVGIYNKLVNLRNGVKNGFAQIDVQLTRRHDLIPNLVEVAKGYMKHERETLEGVITARNAAVSGLKNASANPSDAGSIKELAGAEAMLTGALGKLFALAEAYPDLKANQNMLALQEELTGTESKIAYARQYYNEQVRLLNTAIETFPSSILAKVAHFAPREFFDIDDEARGPVDVSFQER